MKGGAMGIEFKKELRITINGKEYTRLSEVPEEFQPMVEASLRAGQGEAFKAMTAQMAKELASPGPMGTEKASPSGPLKMDEVPDGPLRMDDAPPGGPLGTEGAQPHWELRMDDAPAGPLRMDGAPPEEPVRMNVSSAVSFSAKLGDELPGAGGARPPAQPGPLMPSPSISVWTVLAIASAAALLILIFLKK